MQRREFLSNTTKTVALGSIIPGFSFSAVTKESALASLLAPTALDNDHVLVIIQLGGGNDGLNTLVPLDQYTNLNIHRSSVIMDEAKVLKINTKVGLHPAMTALKTMYDEGKVNFVQSVGYPNQNFSHFRSTDIWLSGADADKVVPTGWLGRYLDDRFPNFGNPNFPGLYPNTDMPDPLAIQIGALVSPGFQGPSVPMAIAVSSDKDFYPMTNNISHSTADTSKPIGKELAFVREIAGQALAYSKVVETAVNKVTTQSAYPIGNALADQLKIVSKLIKGGLKTKIYMVGISGFDTHANQVDTADHTKGSHADLLSKVSEAISAFQKDLKFQNIEDRVIGMTFSEFGRRIKSNGSSGTDHGAALPMIFFGTNVQNGIIGVNPTIDPFFTDSDNLPMQYDFRSVYASVLKQWFCVDDIALEKVMLKAYQTLPILKNSACTTSSIEDYQKEIEEKRLQCYPNPFNDTDKLTVEINSKGGDSLIEIFNTEGRMVDTILNEKLGPGVHSFEWKHEGYKTGFYYCRYQSGDYQSVFTLQKVR